jgi:hypothetical protein
MQILTSPSLRGPRLHDQRENQAEVRAELITKLTNEEGSPSDLSGDLGEPLTSATTGEGSGPRPSQAYHRQRPRANLLPRRKGH